MRASFSAHTASCISRLTHGHLIPPPSCAVAATAVCTTAVGANTPRLPAPSCACSGRTAQPSARCRGSRCRAVSVMPSCERSSFAHPIRVRNTPTVRRWCYSGCAGRSLRPVGPDYFLTREVHQRAARFGIPLRCELWCYRPCHHAVAQTCERIVTTTAINCIQSCGLLQLLRVQSHRSETRKHLEIVRRVEHAELGDARRPVLA